MLFQVRSVKHLALILGATLLISGSVPAAQLKTPIRGLVSMGAYRFVSKGGDPVNTLEPMNEKPGIFGGIVILATWRELQPSADSGIPENNNIDRALEEVRAYNSKNPEKPLAVKLRVWAGFEAPDWAKELGGGPIATVHKGKPVILGRFWTVPYRNAWVRFQKLLAERYDAEPLIHEVAVTSCMCYTAEPFFLPTNEPSVVRPLSQAGFKPFMYKQCLRHAVEDYAPWKTTLVEIPLNPLWVPGAKRGDVAFTEEVMRSFRKSFGRRCVFDNHDLDAKPPGDILKIYEIMKRLGPPIEFQTYHETPPDFDGTIKLGVSLGAGSIELWQDYKGFRFEPVDRLKRWAALL
jgi:hypothetical protein